MQTLEEAIGIFEELSKFCETNGLYVSQELYKQHAEWLRELAERRKEPEILRCGECEHFRKENNGEMWCGVSNGHSIDKNFFCRDAERRTE